MGYLSSYLTTFFGMVTCLLILREQRYTIDEYNDIEDISSCIQNIDHGIHKINVWKEKNTTLIHVLEKKLDSLTENNNRELGKLKMLSNSKKRIITELLMSKPVYNEYKEKRDNNWF